MQKSIVSRMSVFPCSFSSQNFSSPKTTSRTGASLCSCFFNWVLSAVLRSAQRKADVPLNVGRESRNVFQQRANPVERLFTRYGQPCHDYPTSKMLRRPDFSMHWIVSPFVATIPNWANMSLKCGCRPSDLRSNFEPQWGGRVDPHGAVMGAPGMRSGIWLLR